MLNKRKILVTRPHEQASHLCELIAARNGKAIPFPTIEIKTTDRSAARLSLFKRIGDFNFVIFVSRNAVKQTFVRYADRLGPLQETDILAIGPGTTESLADYGYKNIQHPGRIATSEALLELPQIKDRSVQGCKILIVKGVGGRDLLAETLKSRGAEVCIAETYQRCLPSYGASEIDILWQKNTKPDAIIVTSNDGLNNLYLLTPEKYKPILVNTPMVVMSERAVELANQLGFVSSLHIATDKNDHGLISALCSLIEDLS